MFLILINDGAPCPVSADTIGKRLSSTPPTLLTLFLEAISDWPSLQNAAAGNAVVLAAGTLGTHGTPSILL